MKDAEIHGLQNYFIGVSRTVEVGVGTEYDRNYNQKKKKKRTCKYFQNYLKMKMLCFALLYVQLKYFNCTCYVLGTDCFLMQCSLCAMCTCKFKVANNCILFLYLYGNFCIILYFCKK